MKKFYVHEIAALNLSKIYFLKNAKKTCKSNNRDLNRDWTTETLEKKWKIFKVNNNVVLMFLLLTSNICHTFF